MAMKTFRLRIAREGYEFEAEGDKAFVMEMLKRFVPSPGAGETPGAKGKEEGKATPKKAIGGPAASGPKALSIREFIQRFSFTKHTDITLAFGYYLEKYSGIGEFTAADINGCYYEAKLESSNTSQMIIRNIKRGYIMPSKTKGKKGKNLYTLTTSGENFITSAPAGKA